MKTFRHLWQYLAEFFSEWEKFQIKVVENIKIHVLCSVTFFSENCVVYDIISKNVAEPERPQMSMWRCVACWISKRTHAQTYACARSITFICTHTHEPTQAGAHSRTETCNTSFFSTATMVSWTRLIVTLDVHCWICLRFFSAYYLWGCRLTNDLCWCWNSYEA